MAVPSWCSLCVATKHTDKARKERTEVQKTQARSQGWRVVRSNNLAGDSTQVIGYKGKAGHR